MVSGHLELIGGLHSQETMTASSYKEQLAASGHKQLLRPSATRNYWRSPVVKVGLCLTTWSEMVTTQICNLQGRLTLHFEQKYF